MLIQMTLTLKKVFCFTAKYMNQHTCTSIRYPRITIYYLEKISLLVQCVATAVPNENLQASDTSRKSVLGTSFSSAEPKIETLDHK